MLAVSPTNVVSKKSVLCVEAVYVCDEWLLCICFNIIIKIVRFIQRGDVNKTNE
jgi:hypothetical protein